MFTWFNKEKDGKVVTAKKVRLDEVQKVVDALESKKEDLTKIIDKLKAITALNDKIEELDDKIKKQINITFNYDFKSEKRLLDAFEAFDVKKLNEAISDTVTPDQKKEIEKAEDKAETTDNKAEADLVNLFEDNAGENKEDKKEGEVKEEAMGKAASLKESLIQKSIKIQAEDNGTNNGIELSDATMNDPKKSEEAGKILEDESKSKEQKETELKAKGLVTEASLYNQVMDGLFRVAEKVEEETKIEDKVEETKEDKVNDIIDNATDFKTEVEELLNVM
jgi:hypothetical protein